MIMAMLIIFLYKCLDTLVCFTILGRESKYCMQKYHCVPLFLFSYDASEKTENGIELGRLVNHGYKKEINVKMKIVIVKRNPFYACLQSKTSFQEAGYYMITDKSITHGKKR